MNQGFRTAAQQHSSTAAQHSARSTKGGGLTTFTGTARAMSLRVLTNPMLMLTSLQLILSALSSQLDDTSAFGLRRRAFCTGSSAVTKLLLLRLLACFQWQSRRQWCECLARSLDFLHASDFAMLWGVRKSASPGPQLGGTQAPGVVPLAAASCSTSLHIPVLPTSLGAPTDRGSGHAGAACAQ